MMVMNRVGLAVVLGLAAWVAAFGQEGARKPANILPAERAGILLMEGREELEQPEKTLDAMGLRNGQLVADLGCGNGFYSLRLAKRIGPDGHVFAVDIQQGMLDQLTARMTEAGVRNVYPVLGEPEDPHLPPGKIDWVLMVDVYHEFSNPEAMLKKIRECLTPEGRVALLEYRGEQDPKTLPIPIPRDHKMTYDEVMREWLPAGFKLVERHEFLPAQHFFVFAKAEEGEEQSAECILPIDVGKITNASAFADKIYFGGQPAAEDLKTLAERGFKTVINLRTAEEMAQLGFDEAAVVQENGMTYVNVPMRGDIPDEVSLQRIFKALDGAADGRVFMHCGSSNRVGAVWALYRAKQAGLSGAEAIEEGKKAGLRAPTLEEQVKAFIESKMKR